MNCIDVWGFNRYDLMAGRDWTVLHGGDLNTQKLFSLCGSVLALASTKSRSVYSWPKSGVS